MNALGQRIVALIKAQGPISIAEFMTLALHDRAAGYYATRDPLGVAGDFITAPEISQMFGELLGLWLAQAWQDQGRPARPLLVELGPGRGTLLADALRALKVAPDFRRSLEVVLVEASPTLRRAQQATLGAAGVPLSWVDDFAAIKRGRPLFIIANEFFDALPIRQYVWSERGWCERMLGVDAEGKFVLALSPPLAMTTLAGAGRLPTASPGNVFEVCQPAQALAEDIGHLVAEFGGAALVIDYGHDLPAFGETLQAVAGHRFADVLADPGASDISAHVDFGAVAAAARKGGAEVFGPVEQGKFLLALGINERAARLRTGEPQKIAAEVERLTGPDQMGTLFKAMAMMPKSAPPPPGF